MGAKGVHRTRRTLPPARGGAQRMLPASRGAVARGTGRRSRMSMPRQSSRSAAPRKKCQPFPRWCAPPRRDARAVDICPCPRACSTFFLSSSPALRRLSFRDPISISPANLSPSLRRPSLRASRCRPQAQRWASARTVRGVPPVRTGDDGMRFLRTFASHPSC